jgi:putative protease
VPWLCERADVTRAETPAAGREGTFAGPSVKPELLAPAGDRDCLTAAVENGADAVYFGLQRHNARVRATNFDGAELPGVMSELHRRGVRGYVTLNTLAFPRELPDLECTVGELTDAGVDAVIVQDLGLARLIRTLSPALEMHASTQMSVTSAEGVRLARELGCARVILARELSLDEVARVRQAVDLPVEVFVHGALCVAYSGQCLTSEALGSRSANRGECAQACRMPYQIVCDGELKDLDDVRYLLSPKDLAAYDLIPRLIELGVSAVKIEGRLKSAEYVANITHHYRRAIDEAWAGRSAIFSAHDIREMELSFSRGFSHGFLDGTNHKVLVRGDYAKKRGLFLGRVTTVTDEGIRLDLAAPVKPGDGLVLDADEAAGLPEQGGRVYEVLRPRGGRNEPGGLSVGPAELRFGRRDLDLHQVRPGQGVWKTDDPELSRRLRQTFAGPLRRTVAIDVRVEAATGRRLMLEGSTTTGLAAHVESAAPLARADRLPATAALIRAQLERLGGTAYRLGALVAVIDGDPLVPKSLLNALRRDLVARLDEAASTLPRRPLADGPVLPLLKARLHEAIAREHDAPPPAPDLLALCRTTPQIEAAVAAGVRTIYADYQDIKDYGHAVAAARRGGAVLFVATPRIEKPRETNIFRFLAKQGADGLLVRNAGGLSYCATHDVPFVADFALNAANELTVELLKARGALRVTASYDLNIDQLLDLLAAVPKDWLEVVVHQQIPMFHMDHCVFCAFLSPGTDATNCGRPCDRHDVKLRDRVGMDHPLKADVGCRNTLFNAVPQTAAEYLSKLISRGARHLRIEFLDDSPDSVTRTINLYREVLEGRRDARMLWRELKATGKYGVTRGPLNVL